jgi:hypothetical protein
MICLHRMSTKPIIAHYISASLLSAKAEGESPYRERPNHKKILCCGVHYMTTNYAVVSASSAEYFPLLKGLLTSVRKLMGKVPVHVPDVGDAGDAGRAAR